MRHFIFTILLVAPLVLTAQSKKEQIATLVLRVDSLSEVLVNDRITNAQTLSDKSDKIFQLSQEKLSLEKDIAECVDSKNNTQNALVESNSSLEELKGQLQLAQDELQKLRKDFSGVNELRNSGDFETFLNYFLLTVSSEQRIDSLIYVSSPLIMDFLHEEIGFGVFYNPGMHCNLYHFHDNEYQGFRASSWVNGIPSPNYGLISIIGMSQNLSFFKNQAPEGGFCEKASSPNGIYYQQVSHIKAGDYIPEGNEDYLEPLILKHLKKMLVVIQMNHWKVASMYFVEFNNKWFLLYLDACDCTG